MYLTPVAGTLQALHPNKASCSYEGWKLILPSTCPQPCYCHQSLGIVWVVPAGAQGQSWGSKDLVQVSSPPAASSFSVLGLSEAESACAEEADPVAGG